MLLQAVMGVLLSYFSHSFAHLLIHSLFQHLLSVYWLPVTMLPGPQPPPLTSSNYSHNGRSPWRSPAKTLNNHEAVLLLWALLACYLCVLSCVVYHISVIRVSLPLLVEQVTFLVGVWAENRFSHGANHHTDAKHFLCDTIRHTLCSSSPGILLLNLFIK